jgi:PAS domain S-box-containing protein
MRMNRWLNREPGDKAAQLYRRSGNIESRYQSLARILGALVILQGGAVYVGWVFCIAGLTNGLPGYNPMSVNCAVCLIAAGTALWLIASDAASSIRRVLAVRALGWFILAISLVTLGERQLGWRTHVDQLLWSGTPFSPYANRMVALTASAFALVAIFFLLQEAKRIAVARTAQFVAIAANLTAQWAVLNVIFRANKVEGISINASFALFALSSGMMMAPNPNGILASLRLKSAGGRLLRSMLPAATILPLLTGWISTEIARAYSTEWRLEIESMVVFSSLALLMVIIRTAGSIDGIELRLSAIVDSSDDAIIGASPEGNIVSWNPGAEKLYGYSAAETIGQSLLLLVPPEGCAEKEARLQLVLDGEMLEPFEGVGIRKDGSRFHVSNSLFCIKNARGEIAGVSSIARDITARKEADRKLRSAALYARRLIEASLDPLVTINRDGKITDVNEATEKVTGCTRDQLIGTEFSRYFTEPEKARQGYRKVFSEGAVRDYPLAIRNGSDRVTEVLYNASVFRNEAGEVEGIFAAARDVTERKRAEEALQKLNQELESRVEARTLELRESELHVRRKLDSILSPEGDLACLELADLLDVPAVQALAREVYHLTQIPFFVLDLKGHVLIGEGWQDICRNFHRATPEACKACKESDRELSTGVACGEFKLYKCKNNMWDVVTPIMLGDRHIGNLFSGQFFFSDETVDEQVFTLQARKYGFDEQPYLEALRRVPRVRREDVRAVMSFYGNLAKLLLQLGHSGVKLARVMTETRQINSQLGESVKELEAFAYSVSHDLRAPLRHLDGFLTLLSKRSYSMLDEQAKHYVDSTLEASQRMGVLIDDLLQFSRLGRSEMQKVPVDLNAMVDQMRRELEPATSGRVIEWHVEPLPRVAADTGMMRQVIGNLLGNAIKFTRNCPTADIEIGSRAGSSGEVVIFVRDNGAGFDMQYYEKLFQVFQRLHGEQEFEGTGIGLANVRRVVERHGGRVWAEGTVGAGATFYFSLPQDSTHHEETHELTESHLVG